MLKHCPGSVWFKGSRGLGGDLIPGPGSLPAAPVPGTQAESGAPLDLLNLIWVGPRISPGTPVRAMVETSSSFWLPAGADWGGGPTAGYVSVSSGAEKGDVRWKEGI